MARLKHDRLAAESEPSVIFALNLKACQFTIYVDLDPEQNRSTTHVAVLDIFLVSARGVDFGLEHFTAVRTLDASQINHGRQSNRVFFLLEATGFSLRLRRTRGRLMLGENKMRTSWNRTHADRPFPPGV
jgi:hypothetical protein